MMHSHDEMPAPYTGFDEATKAVEIQEACDVADFAALAALAGMRYGLVSDELRRRACWLPLSLVSHRGPADQ
jgi:hypothetical protein